MIPLSRKLEWFSHRMLSRFARLRKVARVLSVPSPRVNQQVLLRRSLATTSSAPKVIQFALSDIGEGTKEVVVKGRFSSFVAGKFHGRDSHAQFRRIFVLFILSITRLLNFDLELLN